MASTSETGHAKNVANLDRVISLCVSYGDRYNPSNSNITLSALNELLTSARDSLTAVAATKATLVDAISGRQAAFSLMKSLSTRVVSALEAAGVADTIVKQAKSIHNKIHGRRKTPKLPTPPEAEKGEGKTISVSQQSFDQLTENLSALIELAATQQAYKPNEPELQVVGLRALYSALRVANGAVTAAYTAYTSKRNDRDSILYGADTGLVPTAGDVKKYIKSVFGTTSTELKQVNGLAFRMVKA